MLEVKIDLVPYGVRDWTKQIGYVKIWNDATGNHDVGNYGFEVRDEDNTVIRTGEYKGHKREDSVFHLLKDILNQEIN